MARNHVCVMRILGRRAAGFTVLLFRVYGKAGTVVGEQW